MNTFGVLGLAIMATMFVGCGSSDSPQSAASAQTAPRQCFTDVNYRTNNINGVCAGVSGVVPQSCYNNATYRAQNQHGICATVPNNLPALCYSDVNYRINNLNGACSGFNNNTNFGNNNDAFCFNQGNCDSGFGNGNFHQTPGNCGACDPGQEVVIDPYFGQISCHEPSRQVLNAVYIGYTYTKRKGQRSQRSWDFGYLGGIFEGNRTTSPVNSCNGSDARRACSLANGNSDCAYSHNANNAVCIPEPGRNYGFCGINSGF